MLDDEIFGNYLKFELYRFKVKWRYKIPVLKQKPDYDPSGQHVYTVSTKLGKVLIHSLLFPVWSTRIGGIFADIFNEGKKRKKRAAHESSCNESVQGCESL